MRGGACFLLVSEIQPRRPAFRAKFKIKDLITPLLPHALLMAKPQARQEKEKGHGLTPHPFTMHTERNLIRDLLSKPSTKPCKGKHSKPKHKHGRRLRDSIWVIPVKIKGERQIIDSISIRLIPCNVKLDTCNFC